MTLLRPLRLAFLTFSFVCQLSANAQEEKNVTLKFLSFPGISNPTPVELVVGEGRTLKVEIPSNELSAPYKVRIQTNWVVGETGIDKDNKPTFTVFGQTPALASNDQ